MKKEITTKDNLNNKYLQREKFIEEHAQIFEALLSGMPSKQDYEQVRDHLDFLLSSQVEQQSIQHLLRIQKILNDHTGLHDEATDYEGVFSAFESYESEFILNYFQKNERQYTS